jgi:hypothetical protein
MALLQRGEADRWLAELGVSLAPVPRAGVTTALDFFDRYMPTLNREKRFGFLKAMDLSRLVQTQTLSPPAMLAAFRLPDEDPMKTFYTKAGTSAHDLGINTRDRQFRRFRVLRPVVVLESWTTGVNSRMVPGLTGIASGGGRQYIVPDAARYLELV